MKGEQTGTVAGGGLALRLAPGLLGQGKGCDPRMGLEPHTVRTVVGRHLAGLPGRRLNEKHTVPSVEGVVEDGRGGGWAGPVCRKETRGRLDFSGRSQKVRPSR